MNSTPIYTANEPKDFILDSIWLSKITNVLDDRIYRYSAECVCEELICYDPVTKKDIFFKLVEKQNGYFDLTMSIVDGCHIRNVYLFPLDGELFDGKKLRYLVVKYARLGLRAYRNSDNLLPSINF